MSFHCYISTVFNATGLLFTESFTPKQKLSPKVRSQLPRLAPMAFKLHWGKLLRVHFLYCTPSPGLKIVGAQLCAAEGQPC